MPSVTAAVATRCRQFPMTSIPGATDSWHCRCSVPPVPGTAGAQSPGWPCLARSPPPPIPALPARRRRWGRTSTMGIQARPRIPGDPRSCGGPRTGLGKVLGTGTPLPAPHSLPARRHYLCLRLQRRSCRLVPAVPSSPTPHCPPAPLLPGGPESRRTNERTGPGGQRSSPALVLPIPPASSCPVHPARSTPSQFTPSSSSFLVHLSFANSLPVFVLPVYFFLGDACLILPCLVLPYPVHPSRFICP